MLVLKGIIVEQKIEFGRGESRNFSPVLDTLEKTYELSEEFRPHIGRKMTIIIQD